MIWLKLALYSTKARLKIVSLTVLSIALSVALLFAVERVREASENSFVSAISDVDLLVGGRSSPINLVLYNMFNIGQATNNVSYESFLHFKNHPSVEWVIPIMLGDSHRGFRIFGTDENFLKHFKYGAKTPLKLAEGQPLNGLWDAVLGAKVAEDLGYKVGTSIVIAHGVTRGEAVQTHEDKPFTVVGILAPTGTVHDQAVYIRTEGFEAIHIDWQSGAAPAPGKEIAPEALALEDIKIQTVTSFLIRTKNRVETLRLQREINTYAQEPLMAVLPSATLHQLWRNLGSFELVLKIISWMVVGTSLLGLLVVLLLTLGERRREMAIYRSVGARPWQINFLLVTDAVVITTLGVAVGWLVQLFVFSILKTWLWQEYGFSLGSGNSLQILYFTISLILFSVLIGLIPGWSASRRALKDGLSLKS